MEVADNDSRRKAGTMLTRGDRVPHLSLRRVDGTTFNYTDIWQRRNLLLVTLTGDDRERETAYIANLAARDEALQQHEATVVITRDRVDGLPAPAVIIADRWGEIYFAESALDVASLPRADDLVEEMRFIAHACPECEGEAR